MYILSTSGMSETAACPPLLLLTKLQLYHLPPPLPPPVSNSSCLFIQCQPLFSSCCTVLLCFSRFCTVGLKMFSLFFCACFLYIIYVLCCAVLSHFSCIRLFATPWTIARQAPLSMEFPGREYWSGLSCAPPGDLPNPGIESSSPVSPALQADSLLLSHQGSILFVWKVL